MYLDDGTHWRAGRGDGEWHAECSGLEAHMLLLALELPPGHWAHYLQPPPWTPLR